MLKQFLLVVATYGGYDNISGFYSCLVFSICCALCYCFCTPFLISRNGETVSASCCNLWMIYTISGFYSFLVLAYAVRCVRGHPFMTSARRGGVRFMWKQGSSPVWTSTQKIKIKVH